MGDYAEKFWSRILVASVRQIVKKMIPTALYRRVEPYGHLLEAIGANVVYGFPSRGMHVIGVTGTNGKTTTTFLIHKMLREAGYNVAMLSTVAYGVNDDIHEQIEHMTTVSSPILQERLRDFKKDGAEWVVIESSSHALAQHRVWGVPYEIAVMTNVTHEHLDYHGTFENYREAKRRLFKIAAKHGRKFGVVNAEDPSAKLFLQTTSRSVSYGLKTGDIIANDVKLTTNDCRFTAVAGKDTYDITIHIPGEFNVSNSLAAVAVGRELGLSKTEIEQGIAALEGVEGRMMKIDEGQPFTAIIDYAGTPDAFERAFQTLRPATRGKLIVVFGSPAHRDKLKRPIQGEIAGRYADEVILTEEDDRDEPGEQIMGEMAAGAVKAGKVINEDLFLIGDRTDAINFAVTRALSPDDTVVTLGKGHEKTIERADGVHPWSEPETMREALHKLN